MGNFLKATGTAIAVIFAIGLVVLALWANVLQSVQAERHDKAVRNTAAFGERATYENFVLKKGCSLRVYSDVGELLVCLPPDGEPTVLIAHGPEH